MAAAGRGTARRAPGRRHTSRTALQYGADRNRVCGTRWDIPSKVLSRVARSSRMTASTGNAVPNRSERWRWLVYVTAALAGAMLTFVGARAQQKASDDATFRRLIESYCAAWSTGNAEAPSKFYAKENGLVFYDVAPFAYHSWKEYHDGVQKEFLDTAESIKLTAGKDLK